MTYRLGMRVDQIALQLYTVRRLAAADLPGTLNAVAAAGYRSVEVAGLPEIAGPELHALLDEAGLQAIAAHQDIGRLRASVDEVADWLATLGCPRVIVPWLPDDERRTADGVRAFASELNGYAQQLGDRGIRLGYHNHSFEFAPLDGTTVWDVLLAELAPGVDLELDVFWASVGGRDPAGEIRATAGRVRLLHMKDRAPGAEPRDAPAGEGILDVPGIVRAGREAGVEWYIAEQDEPQDALRDVGAAYRNLELVASRPS
jgi:sugar phosphate isomerase/epimerase